MTIPSIKVNLSPEDVESPQTPNTSIRTELITPAQVWQGCLAIAKAVESHKLAWPFLEPVDPVALNIPSYPTIIKNPMDLGTVRYRLANKRYQTLQQYVNDTRLVFTNCTTFNDAGSEVHRMAKDLSKYFEQKLSKAFYNKKVDELADPNEGMTISEEDIGFYLKSTAETELPPETPMNDGICAICEVEGNLLCCDGPCMRSFHLVCMRMHTFPDDAVWLCPECEGEVHECFACKEEGAVDVEVFKCSHITCGRFYHTECVHALGLTVKKHKPSKFLCPLHTCAKCKLQGHSGLFSKCFRCPIAYHYSCMPQESLDGNLNSGEKYAFRVNNIYVVCPEHPSKQMKNVPASELLNATTVPKDVGDAEDPCLTLFREAKKRLVIGEIPKTATLLSGNASYDSFYGNGMEVPSLLQYAGHHSFREMERFMNKNSS